jgi:hypothetical protein
MTDGAGGKGDGRNRRVGPTRPGAGGSSSTHPINQSIRTDLGAARTKVFKKASAWVLNSEVATLARGSRDHNVRRRVEALLEPHGLRLFSSSDGDSGGDDDDDDDDDDDGAREREGERVSSAPHCIACSLSYL